MAPIFFPSNLFTLGRACAGPLAIVLHEYKSGIEMLDQDMNRCPRPRPLQSPGCHTSYHFGIGGNCKFHQYVPIADTAWGFGVLPAQLCPVPPCPPDPCESCTGATVDQYNPDEDGNPPVLPPFVIGPDGTVNCGVIHVAVNSIWPPNLAGICCDPNPDAYECLVNSLCEIYQLSGLLPSQTTLLVHCGELPCLDIDQLVLDILACVNAPPPVEIPCTCTPTTDQFCSALSTIADGAVAVPGTTLLLGDDCLFHQLPPAVDIVITAVDTPCLDLTVTEAPANTFVITGSPIISPTIGNNLTCAADGLFVPTPPDVAINVTDTPCFDLTVVEDPANSFMLTGSPIISPDAGNQLVCSPNGLLVPAASAADVTVVGLDTTTIDITVVEGPVNTFTISAEVIDVPDEIICDVLSSVQPAIQPFVPNVFVVGTDCLGYQSQSLVCDALSKQPTGNTILPGLTEILIEGCLFGTMPTYCEMLSGALLPNGGDAVPGTVLVGADCQTYTVPVDVPFLACDGNPIPPGSFLALASQIGIEDNGSTDLTFGLMIPDIGACPSSGQILHPPVCDDVSVQNTNFNDELYIGRDNFNATGLAWKNRFSDPVFLTGGNGTLDLSLLRADGQNVIIVDNGGISGTTTLNNPPTGCANKHLYIKNISSVPESFAAAALIDGVGSITLDGTVPAGYPFGNNGGEAVHLVWSDTNNTWYVL